MHLLLLNTGKELYNMICEYIPKLKTRQGGGKSGGGLEQMGGLSTGGGTGAGSKKKKGRRK